MSLFSVIAILITTAALLSYVNHRFVGMPTTIGLMVIALLISLTLNILGNMGFGLEHEAKKLLSSIDFGNTLLHGMLSFLLFAGARGNLGCHGTGAAAGASPRYIHCHYLRCCCIFHCCSGTYHQEACRI